MENNKVSNELQDDYPLPEMSFADLYHFRGYKKAKLILIWGEKLSKNKQVVILRKRHPKLRELTAVEICGIIKRNKIQWQFAEMSWGMAVDFVDKAKKLGLDIILEEI